MWQTHQVERFWIPPFAYWAVFWSTASTHSNWTIGDRFPVNCSAEFLNSRISWKHARLGITQQGVQFIISTWPMDGVYMRNLTTSGNDICKVEVTVIKGFFSKNHERKTKGLLEDLLIPSSCPFPKLTWTFNRPGDKLDMHSTDNRPHKTPYNRNNSSLDCCE